MYLATVHFIQTHRELSERRRGERGKGQSRESEIRGRIRSGDKTEMHEAGAVNKALMKMNLLLSRSQSCTNLHPSITHNYFKINFR